MVKHDEKGHGAREGASGIITAVYKLNLDCLQCVKTDSKVSPEDPRYVIRSLRAMFLNPCYGHTYEAGVQGVDVDTESNEIKMKGRIDAKEIHEQMVKISKRKVEMVTLQCVQPKNKVDSSVSQKKGTDEEKKEVKELSLKKEIKEVSFSI